MTSSLPDPHTPPKDDPRTFVVVGAGAAGTGLRGGLRGERFWWRIVLVEVGGEPGAGYDRTVLSKFVLAGEMSPKDVPPLRMRRSIKRNGLNVQGEVTSLDAPGKTLHLNNGGILRYDAAVLATGGAPNPLKPPGAGLANVFVLRSKAQAEQIINAAQPGQRAVIIGDSFIALECASALRE